MFSWGGFIRLLCISCDCPDVFPEGACRLVLSRAFFLNVLLLVTNSKTEAWHIPMKCNVNMYQYI